MTSDKHLEGSIVRTIVKGRVSPASYLPRIRIAFFFFLPFLLFLDCAGTCTHATYHSTFEGPAMCASCYSSDMMEHFTFLEQQQISAATGEATNHTQLQPQSAAFSTFWSQLHLLVLWKWRCKDDAELQQWSKLGNLTLEIQPAAEIQHWNQQRESFSGLLVLCRYHATLSLGLKLQQLSLDFLHQHLNNMSRISHITAANVTPTDQQHHLINNTCRGQKRSAFLNNYTMQPQNDSILCRITANTTLVEPKKLQLKRIIIDVSRATLKKLADLSLNMEKFTTWSFQLVEKASKCCNITANTIIVEPKKFQLKRLIRDVSRATLKKLAVLSLRSAETSEIQKLCLDVCLVISIIKHPNYSNYGNYSRMINNQTKCSNQYRNVTVLHLILGYCCLIFCAGFMLVPRNNSVRMKHLTSWSTTHTNNQTSRDIEVQPEAPHNHYNLKKANSLCVCVKFFFLFLLAGFCKWAGCWSYIFWRVDKDTGHNTQHSPEITGRIVALNNKWSNSSCNNKLTSQLLKMLLTNNIHPNTQSLPPFPSIIMLLDDCSCAGFTDHPIAVEWTCTTPWMDLCFTWEDSWDTLYPTTTNKYQLWLHQMKPNTRVPILMNQEPSTTLTKSFPFQFELNCFVLFLFWWCRCLDCTTLNNKGLYIQWSKYPNLQPSTKQQEELQLPFPAPWNSEMQDHFNHICEEPQHPATATRATTFSNLRNCSNNNQILWSCSKSPIHFVLFASLLCSALLCSPTTSNNQQQQIQIKSTTTNLKLLEHYMAILQHLFSSNISPTSCTFFSINNSNKLDHNLLPFQHLQHSQKLIHSFLAKLRKLTKCNHLFVRSYMVCSTTKYVGLNFNKIQHELKSPGKNKAPWELRNYRSSRWSCLFLQRQESRPAIQHPILGATLNGHQNETSFQFWSLLCVSWFSCTDLEPCVGFVRLILDLGNQHL